MARWTDEFRRGWQGISQPSLLLSTGFAAFCLALATAVNHPIPGQVVVGIKTADVDAAAKAVEASGGGIVKGPYDDAHERRAVVYDNKGNGVVFYKPLAR